MLAFGGGWNKNFKLDPLGHVLPLTISRFVIKKTLASLTLKFGGS
jgi:hypothetical protein